MSAKNLRRLLIRPNPVLAWTGLMGLLLLGGCESAPVLPTPSGLPEVSVSGRSSADITEAIGQLLTGRGYTRKNVDTEELVFDRPYDKAGAAPHTGSCLRVRVRITEQAGTHRISALPYSVSNCGAAFESETVVHSAYPQIQSLLDQLKAQLAGS